jgi:hypothetical protein
VQWRPAGLVDVCAFFDQPLGNVHVAFDGRQHQRAFAFAVERVDVGFGPAHQDFNGFHGSEATTGLSGLPAGVLASIPRFKSDCRLPGLSRSTAAKFVVNAGMSYECQAENPAKQRPKRFVK